jgi:hypothetical protein
MTNPSAFHKAALPTGAEGALFPADLQRVINGLAGNMTGVAESTADRDANFNGFPAGGLVVCAALKAIWMSLGKLGTANTQWEVIYQGVLDTAGADAVYWTGTLAIAKTLVNLQHTSVKMSTVISSGGNLVPTWDGDTFSLPAGVYDIRAQYNWDTNTVGYRAMNLYKNPAATTHGSTTAPTGVSLRGAPTMSNDSGQSTTQFAKVTAVAATDRLLLIGRQSSGGNLNINAGGDISELTIVRLGS